MTPQLLTKGARAERRAIIGQRPMLLGRHRQSAGTAGVRPQLAKPAARWRNPPTGRLASALAPLGDRPVYPPDEGLQARAERRAAPKPDRIPLGDRPVYPPDEGLQARAERRAAPKPARIPSGDRPVYPPDEGLQ